MLINPFSANLNSRKHLIDKWNNPAIRRVSILTPIRKKQTFCRRYLQMPFISMKYLIGITKVYLYQRLWWTFCHYLSRRWPGAGQRTWTRWWSIPWRVYALSGHSELKIHYNDVMMSAMASQITGVSVVYAIVCPGTDQRNHQSASLAFARGIHREPVNSPHKGPVTRKMFPLDNVIMIFFRTESRDMACLIITASRH